MNAAEELIEIFLWVGTLAGAVIATIIFGAGVLVGWLLL